MSICEDPRVGMVGSAAREATKRRLGAVIVGASAVGSWRWCPRKAWHDTTLFNSGWLPRRLPTRLLEGLAGLWEAQLTRSRKPSVRRGRRIHGEYVGAELEVLDSCSIVESGIYGLLEPSVFEKQLARYESIEDPVEYYRSEEFPLIAHRFGHVLLAGVPDDIRRGDKGLIVYELKTTRSLERFLSGPGLDSALNQLAAYALILSQRWRVEKVLLEVRGREATRIIEYPADALLREKGEEVLEIARRLASPQPPEGSKNLCKNCEYNKRMPSCSFILGADVEY